MWSMKNVAVSTEDGGFDSSRVPHLREFAIQGKKNVNGWSQLELTDA